MSPADAARDRLLSVVWTAQAIATLGRAREAVLRFDRGVVVQPAPSRLALTAHLRQCRRDVIRGVLRFSVARGLIRVSSRDRSPI